MNETAVTPAAPTPLRKLTVKTVYGKVPAQLPEKGSLPLIQIIGSATDVRKGESDFGEWEGLVGNFEAVNLKTGEVFEGPQAFIPEPYNSMIANKLKGEGRAKSVEFALEIGVKLPGPDDTVRYNYTVKAVQDPSEGDPLEKLRSRFPKLAAPSAPVTLEHKPEGGAEAEKPALAAGKKK